jgi:hypothetical protein
MFIVFRSSMLQAHLRYRDLCLAFIDKHAINGCELRNPLH